MNPSKKRFKIIFPVVFTIIMLLSVFNSHRIKFLVDMVKIYNSTEKGTNIVGKEPYETNPINIENPLEAIIKESANKSPIGNKDKSNHIGSTPSNIVAKPNDSTNKNISSISNKNEKTSDEKREKSVKEYSAIIKKYNTALVELQADFQVDLDTMVKEGIADYNSGMSYSQMFSKYLDYGANLEKNSDKKFNLVLKNIQKELRDNGHNTSIIGEIQDYYNSTKKAIKNDIINRGMKHF